MSYFTEYYEDQRKELLRVSASLRTIDLEFLKHKIEHLETKLGFLPPSFPALKQVVEDARMLKASYLEFEKRCEHIINEDFKKGDYDNVKK